MFASCVYERRAIINLCGKMQDKTQQAKTSKQHSFEEKRERKKGLAQKRQKKKTQNHPEFPALFFPSF